RVKDLVAKMSLSEKIAQMHGNITAEHILVEIPLMSKRRFTWNTPADQRLGIPGIRSVDGPRGSALGQSTCFPAGICRGASWDRDLEERIGTAMGFETRAQGGNMHLSPCINLVRHPSGGRNQETFGEDTHHVGVMGVAQTAGIQRHVMACPKHYAANNQEGNRFSVNVRMSERVLREIYLPHFKKCVDAGAAGIMSAYNDLNGHLCGQNKHLCREILKEDWGFQGFVVSDWINAVDDAVAAAQAGLDLEMPAGAHYGGKLKRAVEAGLVPQSMIDESVTRLLRMKLKFISEDMKSGYDQGMVAGPGHTALAREAAAKGMVLLKNDNAALPLDRGKIRTVAVMGSLADVANIGDKGSSSVNPPYRISPLQGLRDRAGGVKIVHESGANLGRARQVARAADAVVVIAGATSKDEGEGGYGLGDRLDLNLHQQELDLIRAAAPETGRLIVVLEGGGAFTLEDWKDEAEAIVMAWYPGMEGGNALADLLFGDENFSGKLPVTFHRSEDQLPSFDNQAKEIEYDYYHGYRLFDKKGLEPLFPFGHGLSYTSYKYANLRLSAKSIGQSGKLKAMVDVTNVGDRAGEEIVQLYVGYNGSRVDRSVKDLKAFGRIKLEPGKTGTMELEVAAPELAYYDQEKGGWEVEEIEYIVYAGPSSRSSDLLQSTFKISGP
ncbi:MAG TPA: glycoside hydrolase family 3 C-terminal domain-containing protein, partial [bacterium]|nr:glycoside hydrolase family 3 C-terminal domain-containing protein [bacterium]